MRISQGHGIRDDKVLKNMARVAGDSLEDMQMVQELGQFNLATHIQRLLWHNTGEVKQLDGFMKRKDGSNRPQGISILRHRILESTLL